MHGNNYFPLSSYKMIIPYKSLYAHHICPSSQSERPVVTPSGDIEMQTFSVTKKVYIFITHGLIVNIMF